MLLAVNVFGQQDSAFHIKGHISGLNNGVIFLHYYGYLNRLVIDSSAIINGDFQFTGKIIQPEVAFIKMSKSPVEAAKPSFIFLEPTEMQVEMKNDPFSTIAITGSVSNNELMEWKAADKKIQEQFVTVNNDPPDNDSAKRKLHQDSLVQFYDQRNTMSYNFMEKYPQSYFTGYFIDGHYQNYTIAQLEVIYNSMGDELQKSIYGKQLLNDMNAMNGSSEGTLAANIVSKDYISNADFDLSALKGKYVLFDFWGSWCVPCIKLLPTLVKEHEQYKGKNIVFVSVARDYNGNQNKCRDIVNKLGMNWINLWDSMDTIDPKGITTAYKVGDYPTFILIDPYGRVIERGSTEYGYLKCKAALEKVL